MNSFQRTNQDQEQHEAMFATALAALTAPGSSRCSTPEQSDSSTFNESDDDEGAVGPYATFNAAPSCISGGRNGEAPQRPQEGPAISRSARISDSLHLQQLYCRCGQQTVILPCGHELCVLCCLRSRGGGRRHPSPPGLCVCAQLGSAKTSFYMEG